METSLQPIGSDYFSLVWEKSIEAKLDSIANGREYFWREKLIGLYRNSSRKISLSTPYNSIRKEIVEMLRNKVTFQAIIKDLSFTIKCSADLYDFEGNTLLHHAVTVGKGCTSFEALGFIQNILVEHKPNLLKKNRDGMIPFQKALCNGGNPITREDVVPFLMEIYVENSYNLGEAIDRYGRNCLHLMATHFHISKQEECAKSIKIIEIFLKSYKDVIKLDAQDPIGLTPFDYSVIHKNYHIAQFLIEAGADPAAGICSSKLNIDSVMAVYESKKVEELKRLDLIKFYEEEEYKPDNKKLSDLKSKNFSQMELVNAINLFRRYFNGHANISNYDREFLISELTMIVKKTSRAHINTTKGAEGYTLLHIAVLSESDEIIKLILRKGGDVNIEDDNENTPVGLSIIKGKVKSLECVIKVSNIAISWPGLNVPNTSTLSYFVLSTCKSARLFELVLKMENVNSKMLYRDSYSKSPQTLSYRDWAFKLQRPIAIFVFIKQEGVCSLPFPVMYLI